MDILSTIKLSATGADQVVREVGKIKKGLEDAAAIGKKIGGKFEAGAGPSGEPTSLGLGGQVRDFFDRKERDNARRREEAENREGRNRDQSRTGGGRGALPGAGIETGARAGAGFTESLAGGGSDALRAWGGASARAGEYLKEKGREATQRAVERAREQADKPPEPKTDEGDITKEVGQGTGRVGAALPIAGAVLAAGGVVMTVISHLAHREIERASMLWSSGISQRLSGAGGDPYSTLRSQYLGLGRRGIPYSAITSYFSALGQQGGGYGAPGTSMQALSTALQYGMDPGALARTIGLRQQAGLEQHGGAMPGYMLGPANLPQGLMTRYVTVIGNAVEEGMRRGITGPALETFSSGTAALMNASMGRGGLSFTGAEALTQGITSHYGGGAQIGSAKEALLFMQMHKPGEDTLSTLERMRNPTEALRRQMQWIDRASGGDRTRRRNMAMGLWSELSPGLVSGLEKAGPDLGLAPIGGRPYITTPEQIAGTGRAKIMAGQAAILADVEDRMVGVLNKTNEVTAAIVNALVGDEGIAAKLAKLISLMGGGGAASD